MKFSQRKYTKKFSFLYLNITFVFLALIFYSSRLQIVNHNVYSGEVNTNTIKQRKLPAPRGDIVDRNGIILATTEYQNDLYAIPHYFKDNLNLLCANLKVNCELLAWKFEKYPLNRILIIKNISNELAEGYKHIPGLFVFHYAKRQYNAETATTHIVGYVGRIGRSMLDMNEDALYADDDYVGKAGLELIYDHEIHGINGAEQYILQANGLELLSPNRFLSKNNTVLAPVKGNDLMLSIDDRFQLILANEIGWRKGGAVVIDVHTGAVLAMYSSPGFDPVHIKNVFSNSDHSLMNRVVSSYAPGSTFKLITALAALEIGIDPHKKFECHGSYYFGGRTWHCWKHEGHGAVDMRDGIKHSCDIYFYQLAQKVGLANIIKYAKALGIGEPTGIDLDVENPGKLPTIKNATPGTLLNTVIGQGVVQVSPLQLANAYATIINGGELHMPRVVASGDPIVRKNSFFKKQSIDFLMDALYAVVNEEGGTAYYSKSSIIEIGGKTGTAQVAGLDKKKKDNAWFVGYYPVIEPQIAVCVFIEQGEHGSSIVPVVNKVIEEYSKEHAPLSPSPKN